MKKSTKRKMSHKRRKKEKSEQRQKVSLLTATTVTATAKTTDCKNSNSKGKKNRKYTNYNINQAGYQTTNPVTSYSQSLQLWWQTYYSAIEFHIQQQRIWQDQSNGMMAEQQYALLEKYANEYETSEEEDVGEDAMAQETSDNENVYMDDEYLKFMEITHTHQEELRVRRAQDNL